MFLVHLGVHSAEKKHDASETIKEEYDKALCDEMSKHKNRLDIHETQSEVYNNQSNVLSTKTTDTTQMSHPPSSKTYSCNICNKKFAVQSKLRFHHLKKHNRKIVAESNKHNLIDDEKIHCKKNTTETDLSIECSSPKSKERHENRRDNMNDQKENVRKSEVYVEKTCNVEPKPAKKDLIVELNVSNPSLELQHQDDKHLIYF